MRRVKVEASDTSLEFVLMCCGAVGEKDLTEEVEQLKAMNKKRQKTVKARETRNLRPRKKAVYYNRK